MVKQEEYILNVNVNNNIDENRVVDIENKIKSNIPLDIEDIPILLDYVIYSTRTLVTRNIYEENYVNKCDMCQSIICNYLNELGVVNYPNLTNHCISDYIIGHSFVVASFDINGVKNNYLLDPTYQQFLIKENCEPSKQLIIKNMKIISPDPGYYIDKEDIPMIEKFVYKGYMPLNEKTAKVFGDSFYKTKTNIPAQFVMPEISGKIYLKCFEKGHELLKQYGIGEVELLSETQKIK